MHLLDYTANVTKRGAKLQKNIRNEFCPKYLCPGTLKNSNKMPFKLLPVVYLLIPT